MARSYLLAASQPRELELGDEALDALEIFERVVAERWPGLSGFPDAEGGRLWLPAVDDLRVDGRTLRGDEDDRAVELLLAVAAALQPRRVFWRFSEMFTLDWDAMDEPTLRAARAAIDTLVEPTWSANEDGPAPWLNTSMEPPGEQVQACSTPADYADWRRRLLEATAGFPYREV